MTPPFVIWTVPKEAAPTLVTFTISPTGYWMLAYTSMRVGWPGTAVALTGPATRGVTVRLVISTLTLSISAIPEFCSHEKGKPVLTSISRIGPSGAPLAVAVSAPADTVAHGP